MIITIFGKYIYYAMQENAMTTLVPCSTDRIHLYYIIRAHNCILYLYATGYDMDRPNGVVGVTMNDIIYLNICARSSLNRCSLSRIYAVFMMQMSGVCATTTTNQRRWHNVYYDGAAGVASVTVQKFANT